MQSISTVRSGMTASLMRMNASASNVANADTVGRVGAGGTAGDQAGYRPVSVAQRDLAGGGTAATYTRSTAPAPLRRDPSSSMADAGGMVVASGVDLVHERIDQIATRSDFEAQARALATADAMERKAIDLIG